MAFATRDFDDWILLEEGGEADVFRARQISLDRIVAVKRLRLSQWGGEKETRRFEEASKLGASLSHPGLVAVIDYGQEGRYYHLVMEYIRGVELGRLVDGEMALPPWLRCRFARQMAEALD
jgi:serine/threonine-protein kinase